MAEPDFWGDASDLVIYDDAFPSRSSDYYALTSFSARQAFVYLLFDAEGGLLYVGRARRPGNRFDRHRRQKPWWGAVARLVLLEVRGSDRIETHDLVSALELYAIRALDPLYNVAGKVA
ncbi:GIY-YIG nuclease family protein [Pimelobacter simplex]|uniref:GIY-YIG nuclease family protein n=1 Tax=Nocardioides simplex TaxID=2045 RepID=UPI003AB1002B